jgi:hypothetical protein
MNGRSLLFSVIRLGSSVAPFIVPNLSFPHSFSGNLV